MTPQRLAIVGDTQRVLPIERLAFYRETNDAARSAVLRAWLLEPADAWLHLGDIVGHASELSKFDLVVPAEARASLPLWVCRGNHDAGGYWFGSAQEHARRFPESVGRLQVRSLGALRLLLLDSNRSVMTATQWQAQRAEYLTALGAAERDERVQWVVVATHHPAFTNGRWHRGNSGVLSDFVAPAADFRKVKLFLSGHVHGYERFEKSGRNFVILGGGGGPRARHWHGRKQRHPVALELPDPHPFHYATLELSSEGVLSLRVHALDERSGGFRLLDQVVTD